MMRETDILAAIRLEHQESIAYLLLSLLALGVTHEEIGELAHCEDVGQVARALLATRRKAGLPPCDLDIHSLVMLSHHQSLPVERLAPPPRVALG